MFSTVYVCNITKNVNQYILYNDLVVINNCIAKTFKFYVSKSLIIITSFNCFLSKPDLVQIPLSFLKQQCLYLNQVCLWTRQSQDASMFYVDFFLREKFKISVVTETMQRMLQLSVILRIKNKTSNASFVFILLSPYLYFLAVIDLTSNSMDAITHLTQ